LPSILRTLGVALTVTLACLALGFPIAYLLAHLRDRTANLLLDPGVAAVLDLPAGAYHRLGGGARKEGVVNSAAAECWASSPSRCR